MEPYWIPLASVIKFKVIDKLGNKPNELFFAYSMVVYGIIIVFCLSKSERRIVKRKESMFILLILDFIS